MNNKCKGFTVYLAGKRILQRRLELGNNCLHHNSSRNRDLRVHSKELLDSSSQTGPETRIMLIGQLSFQFTKKAA